MEFKIHGATPKTGKPICTTCKYATTILGQNMEERVLCSAGMFNNSGGIVTFKIAQCGSYHPMNVPWKHGTDCVDRASSPPGSIGFSNSGWRGPDGSHDKATDAIRRSGFADI